MFFFQFPWTILLVGLLAFLALNSHAQTSAQNRAQKPIIKSIVLIPATKPRIFNISVTNSPIELKLEQKDKFDDAMQALEFTLADELSAALVTELGK
jgi:hypothetical protein